MNQKITIRVLLMGSPFKNCESASPTSLHGLSGRNMLNLVRHTNLCIHNSGSYMFLWVVPLHLYSDPHLSIDSQGYVCDRVHQCLLFLWSVKPSYFRRNRRTKLQNLIHIQDWVKVVVFRRSNAKPAFVLFYLGVLPYLCQEYHGNCTISYDFLMQWYFAPSSFISRSSCCCNRNVDNWLWCVK